MPGILLRLTGPLQSWGSQSRFHLRDTAAYPTRSGLLGMLAAACGIPRGGDLGELAQLDFTVRVDRPGVRTLDFHTVGGGLPRDWTVPTAEGGRRPEGGATIVTRRHYLADAAFVAAVTGETSVLERVLHALAKPTWQPFLGRRSCPPEQPLSLGAIHDDALAELLRVPIARTAPRGADDVGIDVVGSRPFPQAAVTPARTAIADDPVASTGGERGFRRRDVYVSTLRLPARLCAGIGDLYLDRLATYLDGQ
ncbi:type I-E CRISPR-associated protein Cas5/CasD [Phytomonospora endophytica]|uniref:CRISPR system Cascade subunit CasD n=1 Tax=Phytomonospora endophytica TaxID=714109 RepID=A0A841G4D9_9ACTN|nr:type I-E CRISPR-associated protein Cas5/CasD [Phytomonospora endophytica]MBB6039589.1 CRISPR system Cascade subunit CasD [Phytomonospora endophytica]GIG70554.1 hypothetical protein Pen01_68490 [Phytomonospora endophytica]